MLFGLIGKPSARLSLERVLFSLPMVTLVLLYIISLKVAVSKNQPTTLSEDLLQLLASELLDLHDIDKHNRF